MKLALICHRPFFTFYETKPKGQARLKISFSTEYFYTAPEFEITLPISLLDAPTANKDLISKSRCQ